MMAMLKTRTNWLTPKKARSTVISRAGVQPRMEKEASRSADKVLLLVDLRAATTGQEGKKRKDRRQSQR